MLFELRNATKVTLGGTHAFFAVLDESVEDGSPFHTGIINVKCSTDRYLFDQDLPRLLPQQGDDSPASTDEIFLIFHNAVWQKEEYLRCAWGRNGGEVRICPMPEDITELIAEWIPYRWRENPIVFVGVLDAFNVFQWAQVWSAPRQLRDEDARRQGTWARSPA